MKTNAADLDLAGEMRRLRAYVAVHIFLTVVLLAGLVLVASVIFQEKATVAVTSKNDSISTDSPPTRMSACHQEVSWESSCADILGQDPKSPTGVYSISINVSQMTSMRMTVHCQMDILGGGWTVIQRRGDFKRREDFFRGIVDYILGFGSADGEYWLGLEAIHALTEARPQQTAVVLEDQSDLHLVTYDTFYVDGAATNYTLSVGDFRKINGTPAEDGLLWVSGCSFSARGFDNDHNLAHDCADSRKSGFWFKSCAHSNLNGVMQPTATSISDTKSVMQWKGLGTLKAAAIMIRPSK